MLKVLCDFMEGSSLLYITTLPGLVAIGIEVVEIKQICHMTSFDHAFKELCDIMS